MNIFNKELNKYIIGGLILIIIGIDCYLYDNLSIISEINKRTNVCCTIIGSENINNRTYLILEHDNHAFHLEVDISCYSLNKNRIGKTINFKLSKSEMGIKEIGNKYIAILLFWSFMLPLIIYFYLMLIMDLEIENWSKFRNEVLIINSILFLISVIIVIF